MATRAHTPAERPMSPSHGGDSTRRARVRDADLHSVLSRKRRIQDSNLNQFSVNKEKLRIYDTATDVILSYFRRRSALQLPDEVLVPLFGELTARSLKKGFPVHLHFEELEFFNSTTISSVIQCILAMRDKGVRTMIRYDGRQKWQKLFFEPLATVR